MVVLVVYAIYAQFPQVCFLPPHIPYHMENIVKIVELKVSCNLEGKV